MEICIIYYIKCKKIYISSMKFYKARKFDESLSNVYFFFAWRKHLHSYEATYTKTHFPNAINHVFIT